MGKDYAIGIAFEKCKISAAVLKNGEIIEFYSEEQFPLPALLAAKTLKEELVIEIFRTYFSKIKEKAKEALGIRVHEAVLTIPSKFHYEYFCNLLKKAAVEAEIKIKSVEIETVMCMCGIAHMDRVADMEDSEKCLVCYSDGICEEVAIMESGGGIIEQFGVLDEIKHENFFSRFLLENNKNNSISQILKNKGLEPQDIDKTYLIGETEDIDFLKKEVRKVFGNEEKIIDGNFKKHILIGTACLAGKYAGVKEASDIVILGVLNHSIGVEKSDGTVYRILEKDTTIPVKTTIEISSLAQEMKRVHIVEGENNMAQENYTIADVNIADLITECAPIHLIVEIDMYNNITCQVRNLDTDMIEAVTDEKDVAIKNVVLNALDIIEKATCSGEE